MDEWARRQFDEQTRRQQEAARQAAELGRRNAERSAEEARRSYDYWFSPAGGFFPTMDRQMEAARRRAEEMRAASEESFRRSQELNARIAEQQRSEAQSRSQEGAQESTVAFIDAGTRQDQLIRSLTEGGRLVDRAPSNSGVPGELQEGAESAFERWFNADAGFFATIHGELERARHLADDFDRETEASRSTPEPTKYDSKEDLKRSVAPSEQTSRSDQPTSVQDAPLRDRADTNHRGKSEDGTDRFQDSAEADREAYDYWFNPSYGFFPTMERQMERARARAEELRSAAEEAFARAGELMAKLVEQQRRAVEMAASADRSGIGRPGASQDVLVALSNRPSADELGPELESMQRTSEAAAREDYRYWFDPNMGFFPTMERQMERARNRAEELRKAADDAFRQSQLLPGQSDRADEESTRVDVRVAAEHKEFAEAAQTEFGAQVRTERLIDRSAELADLARYVAAYRAPFSETESLRELWVEASAGLPDSRSGYDRARDRFWAEIREGSSAAAVEAANMLSAAGFEFASESGAPERRDMESLSMRDRRLSIDHAVPGSKEKGRWLDPTNLRFMFEGDNVERNSFFNGNDEPYKGWEWHWNRKSLRPHD